MNSLRRPPSASNGTANILHTAKQRYYYQPHPSQSQMALRTFCTQRNSVTTTNTTFSVSNALANILHSTKQRYLYRNSQSQSQTALRTFCTQRSNVTTTNTTPLNLKRHYEHSAKTTRTKQRYLYPNNQSQSQMALRTFCTERSKLPVPGQHSAQNELKLPLLEQLSQTARQTFCRE